MKLGCGYAGKIVTIDLTKDKILREDLDWKMAKNFVGGYGLSLKFAYELIKPGVDPFSSDNFIIIGPGPLVGTPAPSSAKTAVVTKYPLTGAIASAVVGGTLGPMLKWAGYDQLIISGKAKKPVYLRIANDEIEILDAETLWGRDIFETTDLLGKDTGVNVVS